MGETDNHSDCRQLDAGCQPMSSVKRLSFALVGMVFFGLALFLPGCNGSSPASDRQNPQAEPNKDVKQVRTARVEQTSLEKVVVVTSTLAAYDQATLSVKVPGRLEAINVDLGSSVKKGQIIAQIEQTDYGLRLQQAEAALAQARARLGMDPNGADDSLDPEQTGAVAQARALLEEATASRDRAATLLKQGVIARAVSDSTEAAYKVALSRYRDAVEEIRNRQALLAQRRSEVALAKQQLADTAILAPFDGVVQERRASIGEYLAASAPVATLVRMNPMRLRAEVPEREARYVHSGQEVRVSVEGDSHLHTGTIKRLSPALTERNRMLIVEAEVLNQGSLRPGSFARAEIVTSGKDIAPTVPIDAIIVFAGIEKLIVVENDKAVEKQITTGRRTADRVEIISGVNVGELVVVQPGNLQSGQPVTVTE
jgi:RND family efflux transporter MFP subunit